MDTYEKKYNDALNWMRELYPGLHGATKEDAEHYFPELRESEDERARKWLVDLVENLGEPADEEAEKELEVMRPLALAYLEKQKEHFRDVTKMMEKQNYSGLNDLERVIHRGFLSAGGKNVPVTIIKETAQECLAQMKVAEWSEDYREEDIQTRFAFYTYKDDPSVLYLSNVFVEETSRNHGFGTRILKAAEKAAEAIGAITICLKVKQDSPANAWYRKHGYGYVAFEDGYDWLEKNLEYLKSTKSAEWSEKDEMIRNAILKYSSNAELVEWSNWLKSLPERFNPQPKQEWSEEDDWKRKELIQYLEEKGDYRTVWMTWLKSLRSQPQGEIYQAAKHDLAIKFMNYLDENRPEGKMSLSNGECEDIDKAFKENDWAKL